MRKHFSSRTTNLASEFLAPRLLGASSYDRISGYFTSSLFSILDEPLESVRKIRMICNSDLREEDIQTAVAASQDTSPLQLSEWRSTEPEKRLDTEVTQSSLERLHRALKSGHLEVRVLPDKVFGLVHGKAGVIRYPDGRATSFMGSVNDTASAWRHNYELLWEDDSPEAIEWVQQEFDTLWHHPHAVPLAKAVIQDIERLSGRHIIGVEDWRDNLKQQVERPGSAIEAISSPLIEAPLYQKENGLWEHQKAFIQQVIVAHNGPHKHARFLLGDQVGLGKTLQLAVSAMIIALQEEKPVLIVAPKTLLEQWQNELWTQLRLPTAYWESQGSYWTDESKGRSPGFSNCSRRIGMIGAQWLARQDATTSTLPIWQQDWSLLIVDEAHRARRKNPDSARKNPQKTALLTNIEKLAKRSKSVLLASATPVQLHPIETFDLLKILSEGAHEVLGGPSSKWENENSRITGLDIAMRRIDIDPTERWDWWRNPIPGERDAYGYPATRIQSIRRRLGMKPEDHTVPYDAKEKLLRDDLVRIYNEFNQWMEEHNPYIERIVMRTRKQLEREGKLKAIEVQLHGDNTEGSIPVSSDIGEAFTLAKRIAKLLADEKGAHGSRKGTTGFAETLLLRRICSSIEAGYISTENMLNNRPVTTELEQDNQNETEETNNTIKITANLRQALEELKWKLGRHRSKDPKIDLILRLLDGKHDQKKWKEDGCIIFTQYLDTAKAVAIAVSKHFPTESVGLYSSELKSGYYKDGEFHKCEREELKAEVKKGNLTLLIGTDAASEGLNLQKLANLINVDLPWNPTKLEQRKGRIQRIGQIKDTIHIYNMRYAGSVEDKVHAKVSDRLKYVSDLFGQLPEVLEDIWINIAKDEEQKAEKLLATASRNELRLAQHPFVRSRLELPDLSSWDQCTAVLNKEEAQEWLSQGWTNQG